MDSGQSLHKHLVHLLGRPVAAQVWLIRTSSLLRLHRSVKNEMSPKRRLVFKTNKCSSVSSEKAHKWDAGYPISLIGLKSPKSLHLVRKYTSIHYPKLAKLHITGIHWVVLFIWFEEDPLPLQSYEDHHVLDELFGSPGLLEGMAIMINHYRYYSFLNISVNDNLLLTFHPKSVSVWWCSATLEHQKSGGNSKKLLQKWWHTTWCQPSRHLAECSNWSSLWERSWSTSGKARDVEVIVMVILGWQTNVTKGNPTICRCISGWKW